jgi:hypothetical protein
MSNLSRKRDASMLRCLTYHAAAANVIVTV